MLFKASEMALGPFQVKLVGCTKFAGLLAWLYDRNGLSGIAAWRSYVSVRGSLALLDFIGLYGVGV